jgi:hypothetical protein
MDIKNHLIECFKKAPAAPFLFVGSGFSRRYLGLPDWKTLLKKFATPEKFSFYSSSAALDLPKVASLMAEDFHQIWWHDETYAESRALFSEFAIDKTSALRFEICQYVASLTAEPLTFLDGLQSEIDALKNLNIEGVITTNWDNLVELLYPDYKTFVGQDELLFANPQSIGEIYKIHGGITRPESLVLTAEDYEEFHQKNPYLASKLITLFVEHPIVFIGYSLADKNVLAQDKLDKLSENLIFVQRAHDSEPGVSKGVMALDEGNLPITIVTSDDYLPIYEALNAVKRKIPARILRYCKEQLYELVKTTETSNKMFVVDANKIVKKDDIEFVIGVGVAAERASKKGYKAINARDLIEDIVLSRNDYDSHRVLADTAPMLGKSSKFVPIFKYLRDVGIDSKKAYKASQYRLDAHLPAGADHYATSAYSKAFARDYKGWKAKDLIQSLPPSKAVNFLPFLPKKDFDVGAVRDFIESYLATLSPGDVLSTPYRKLACAFDSYVYGW